MIYYVVFLYVTFVASLACYFLFLPIIGRCLGWW